jgi:hypothetical protein
MAMSDWSEQPAFIGAVAKVQLSENARLRQVHARLDQRGPKTVAQGMWMAGRNAGLFPVIVKDAAQPFSGEWLTTVGTLGHHKQLPFICRWSSGEQVRLD